MQQQVGIVIRADGTVPMDTEVPLEIEQFMIGVLAGNGHDVRWTADAGYRIEAWPA